MSANKRPRLDNVGTVHRTSGMALDQQGYRQLDYANQNATGSSTKDSESSWQQGNMHKDWTFMLHSSVYDAKFQKLIQVIQTNPDMTWDWKRGLPIITGLFVLSDDNSPTLERIIHAIQTQEIRYERSQEYAMVKFSGESFTSKMISFHQYKGGFHVSVTTLDNEAYTGIIARKIMAMRRGMITAYNEMALNAFVVTPDLVNAYHLQDAVDRSQPIESYVVYKDAKIKTFNAIAQHDSALVMLKDLMEQQRGKGVIAVTNRTLMLLPQCVKRFFEHNTNPHTKDTIMSLDTRVDGFEVPTTATYGETIEDATKPMLTNISLVFYDWVDRKDRKFMPLSYYMEIGTVVASRVAEMDAFVHYDPIYLDPVIWSQSDKAYKTIRIPDALIQSRQFYPESSSSCGRVVDIFNVKRDPSCPSDEFKQKVWSDWSDDMSHFEISVLTSYATEEWNNSPLYYPLPKINDKAQVIEREVPGPLNRNKVEQTHWPAQLIGQLRIDDVFNDTSLQTGIEVFVRRVADAARIRELDEVINRGRAILQEMHDIPAEIAHTQLNLFAEAMVQYEMVGMFQAIDLQKEHYIGHRLEDPDTHCATYLSTDNDISTNVPPLPSATLLATCLKKNCKEVWDAATEGKKTMLEKKAEIERVQLAHETRRSQALVKLASDVAMYTSAATQLAQARAAAAAAAAAAPDTTAETEAKAEVDATKAIIKNADNGVAECTRQLVICEQNLAAISTILDAPTTAIAHVCTAGRPIFPVGYVSYDGFLRLLEAYNIFRSAQAAPKLGSGPAGIPDTPYPYLRMEDPLWEAIPQCVALVQNLVNVVVECVPDCVLLNSHLTPVWMKKASIHHMMFDAIFSAQTHTTPVWIQPAITRTDDKPAHLNISDKDTFTKSIQKVDALTVPMIPGAAGAAGATVAGHTLPAVGAGGADPKHTAEFARFFDGVATYTHKMKSPAKTVLDHISYSAVVKAIGICHARSVAVSTLPLDESADSSSSSESEPITSNVLISTLLNYVTVHLKRAETVDGNDLSATIFTYAVFMTGVISECVEATFRIVNTTDGRKKWNAMCVSILAEIDNSDSVLPTFWTTAMISSSASDTGLKREMYDGYGRLLCQWLSYAMLITVQTYTDAILTHASNKTSSFYDNCAGVATSASFKFLSSLCFILSSKLNCGVVYGSGKRSIATLTEGIKFDELVGKVKLTDEDLEKAYEHAIKQLDSSLIEAPYILKTDGGRPYEIYTVCQDVLADVSDTYATTGSLSDFITWLSNDKKADTSESDKVARLIYILIDAMYYYRCDTPLSSTSRQLIEWCAWLDKRIQPTSPVDEVMDDKLITAPGEWPWIPVAATALSETASTSGTTSTPIYGTTSTPTYGTTSTPIYGTTSTPTYGTTPTPIYGTTSTPTSGTTSTPIYGTTSTPTYGTTSTPIYGTTSTPTSGTTSASASASTSASTSSSLTFQRTPWMVGWKTVNRLLNHTQSMVGIANNKWDYTFSRLNNDILPIERGDGIYATSIHLYESSCADVDMYEYTLREAGQKRTMETLPLAHLPSAFRSYSMLLAPADNTMMSSLYVFGPALTLDQRDELRVYDKNLTLTRLRRHAAGAYKVLHQDETAPGSSMQLVNPAHNLGYDYPRYLMAFASSSEYYHRQGVLLQYASPFKRLLGHLLLATPVSMRTIQRFYAKKMVSLFDVILARPNQVVLAHDGAVVSKDKPLGEMVHKKNIVMVGKSATTDSIDLTHQFIAGVHVLYPELVGFVHAIATSQRFGGDGHDFWTPKNYHTHYRMQRVVPTGDMFAFVKGRDEPVSMTPMSLTGHWPVLERAASAGTAGGVRSGSTDIPTEAAYTLRYPNEREQDSMIHYGSAPFATALWRFPGNPVDRVLRPFTMPNMEYETEEKAGIWENNVCYPDELRFKSPTGGYTDKAYTLFGHDRKYGAANVRARLCQPEDEGSHRMAMAPPY